VIRCELSGHVAEVVMSRPPTNALTIADLHVLRDVFRDLSDDESVSAVVLRADGAGFSSGIDFKEIQSPRGRELLLDSGLACREAFLAIRTCAVPVVVGVHGYCRGAGVALVASSDIAVATTDARFALPEGSWSIAHFARMLPPMRLRQVTLACEPVEADELLTYGSIHSVVEPGSLVQETRMVARALCGQRRVNLVAAKARLNLVDPFDSDPIFWAEQALVLEASVQDLGSARDTIGQSDAR
jgi:enoyl-CoA hydratase